MQQFYGVDIDGVETGGVRPLRAAALCAQLPPASRVARAEEPANEWDQTDYLLHSIEYSLRVLVWQNSEDGRKGRRRPKPIPTPAETASVRKRLEKTDIAAINAALGYGEVIACR